MAAKAASNENLDVQMTACNDKSGRRKTMQQLTSKGISKSGQWWAAMVATLWCNSNKRETMMERDGRCDGNTSARTAMEGKGGGDNGGVPTSGRQQ